MAETEQSNAVRPSLWEMVTAAVMRARDVEGIADAEAVATEILTTARHELLREIDAERRSELWGGLAVNGVFSRCIGIISNTCSPLLGEDIAPMTPEQVAWVRSQRTAIRSGSSATTTGRAAKSDESAVHPECPDCRCFQRSTNGSISDGYNEFLRCDRGINCGLEIVRIGKVQCWCDDGSTEPPNYDDVPLSPAPFSERFGVVGTGSNGGVT